MIELYDHPVSPCAQKVRLVMAEKGIEFELRPIDLASKQNLSPEYLQLNPAGLVPTLAVDGRPIPESTVICELLDDLYPEPGLRPVDPFELAQMRMWTKRLDEALHPACGALQWPMFMLPVLAKMSSDEAEALLAKVPDPVRRGRQQELYRNGMAAPVAAAGVKTYDKFLGDMEQLLGSQPWLAGQIFSLADTGVIPYFQTLRQFGWTELYDQRPAVTDWVERCFSRPSYKQAIGEVMPPSLLEQMAESGPKAWPQLKAALNSD